MTAIDLVTYGRERARIGPWNGDDAVGLVAPQPGGPPASAALVRRCLERLAGAGFTRAVTGALGPDEQRGFLAAGFTVNERLHLLRHDLRQLPGPPEAAADYSLRRASARDRSAALVVDHASFGAFWRLDGGGLDEARTATPHSRFRVGQRRADPTVAGYVVSGRHVRRGYIQRLAVEPAHRGNGLGSLLVLDALHWLRRWRTTAVFVNTQESNAAALALYERLGFAVQPEGLTVLTAPVGA